MFKYSIAAKLTMALASCGGSSSEKNVADNSNAASGTTSSGTAPASGTVGGAITVSSNIPSTSVTTVSVPGLGATCCVINGPAFITLTSEVRTLILAPAGTYTILLGAGPDLQTFVTIIGAVAGDTIETGTPITNSSWLAAGETPTISFDANEVLIPDPATASLADYANYAVRSVAVESGDAAWFDFGSDTYLVENVQGQEYNFTGSIDVLVKLAGPVKLANARIVGGAVVLQ